MCDILVGNNMLPSLWHRIWDDLERTIIVLSLNISSVSSTQPVKAKLEFWRDVLREE